MAALPLTTLTETFLGLTSSGLKMYQMKAICTGTGAGAEITATIPLTKIKVVKGTPALTITDNADAAYHGIESVSASANTLTVVVDADVGANAIAIAGVVLGL